jgi:hypothetical protein
LCKVLENKPIPVILKSSSQIITSLSIPFPSLSLNALREGGNENSHLYSHEQLQSSLSFPSSELICYSPSDSDNTDGLILTI